MPSRQNSPVPLSLLAIAIASSALTGCEAVKGIFKAGVWTGVILVAVVIGLIFAVMGRAKSA
jgi:hypothetical protein